MFLSVIAEPFQSKKLQQSGCSGSSCPAAYIGLRKDSDGEFTSWVDDSPFGGSVYANWNSGEPNNAAPYNNNVHDHNYHYDDDDNTHRYDNHAELDYADNDAYYYNGIHNHDHTHHDNSQHHHRTDYFDNHHRREFDCRTVRTNVNCSAANSQVACDAQCRLFKYGRGICHSYGYG
ncbi:hypothetical protein AAVH_27399 [Aphelenchoides avenae]|nr:hypothetical protein AAVH_27399 [Aphelenchus avenae]